MRAPFGLLLFVPSLAACGDGRGSTTAAAAGDGGLATAAADGASSSAPGSPVLGLPEAGGAADGGGPDPGNPEASTPTPPSPGDSGGVVTPPSGSFSLQTTNPSYQAPAGFTGVSAASGTRFFFVSATVKNSTETTALSLAPTFFTLSTAAHLVISLSAASSVLPGLCNAAVAVGEGGSATCNLVFEVPTTDSPVTLVYTDTLARTASAPITLPATPTGACINPSSGGDNCVACMEDYCDSAVVQWDDDDESICEADNEAAASCTTCACYEGALTVATCASVYQALSQCAVQYCQTTCAFFD